MCLHSATVYSLHNCEMSTLPSPDLEERREELDTACLELLDRMNDRLRQGVELDTIVRGGWLHMAKARATIGVAAFSEMHGRRAVRMVALENLAAYVDRVSWESSPDLDETRVELGTACLELLDRMNDRLRQGVELDTIVRGGWLHMAKARATIGVAAFSEMHGRRACSSAGGGVIIEQNDEGEIRLAPSEDGTPRLPSPLMAVGGSSVKQCQMHFERAVVAVCELATTQLRIGVCRERCDALRLKLKEGEDGDLQVKLKEGKEEDDLQVEE